MTVRLGIIGCGAIAEDMHVPTALNVKQVQLAALIDSDIEQCKRLADKFGVKHTACNIDSVAQQLDAVIIATPPHTRRKLAEEAFQHGLHVFCEKPFANTVAECEAIISAARATERKLTVCHPLRFYPLRRQLLDLVKKHNLGEIIHVVATEGKPYSWPTVTGYTVRREMSPGGVMINAGIHTLDSLLWWFGDPTDVRYEDDSAGGLESNVRIWMQFPGDIECFFRQSRTCQLPNRISIMTERGSLVFGTNSIAEYQVKQNGHESNHTCADSEVDHGICWNEQLIDFAESIIQNREPLVSGDEGMRVIRLIERCYAMKRFRLLPLKAPIPGLTW